MWRVWIVWNFKEDTGLPSISKASQEIAQSCEKVSMLFTIDYLQMREYFNMIIKNFVEFGELENHFILSFYRYLNLCSISHMKHFLKDLSRITLNEPIFENFIVDIQNFCYTKINSKSHD